MLSFGHSVVSDGVVAKLVKLLSAKVTCFVAVLEPKIAETVTKPLDPFAENFEVALVVLLKLVLFELFQ